MHAFVIGVSQQCVIMKSNVSVDLSRCRVEVTPAGCRSHSSVCPPQK